MIPLLSGHIGGANALAVELAEKLGATAVVTTATDVRGKFSVDAWAARHGCVISDMGLAKAVSAAILEKDIPLCSQFSLPAPLPEGTFAGESGPLGVFIGWRTKAHFARTLRLIPRVLRVGVGCRRGISAEAVVRAVQTVFAENGLDTAAICGVCSIDLKQDEAGLLAACEKTTGRCIFTRRSSCGMWRVTSLPPTSSAPLPAWTMSVSGRRCWMPKN